MSLHQRFLWTRSLAFVAGLALFALLLWAPQVGAAPLTTSQEKTFRTSEASATVTLDRFDSALGELESVLVEYRVTGTAEDIVTVRCRDTPCSRTSSKVLTLSLQAFTLGSISLSGSDTDTLTITCSAPADSRDDCGGKGSTVVQGGDSATDATTLGLFDDPGTFSLTFDFSAPGTFSERLSGFVRVTYTYVEPDVAVSEPGVVALAAVALLAGLGRRRPAPVRQLRRAAVQSA